MLLVKVLYFSICLHQSSNQQLLITFTQPYDAGEQILQQSELQPQRNVKDITVIGISKIGCELASGDLKDTNLGVVKNELTAQYFDYILHIWQLALSLFKIPKA